jgi:hypothetical protein
MFGVGYQLGISGSQSRSWMTPIMVFSFSLVLLLIASLDRPGNSFITVSQQPLVDLRASMEVGPWINQSELPKNTDKDQAS